MKKAVIEIYKMPSKLEIIKLVKDTFKLGLKEAKEIVDNNLLFFGKPEDFSNVKPEFIIPEMDDEAFYNFTDDLNRLHVSFRIKKVETDESEFKYVEDLKDIGKYVIVPVDVLIKLKECNSKKDEKIANLTDTISSLEEKIRDLESRKYDHLTIIQELENIIKRY